MYSTQLVASPRRETRVSIAASWKKPVTDFTPAEPEDEAPATDASTISISTEMRRSYLDYAMSVIVSRAIPDVRDGLKPVHRRILFAMQEGGYHWNRPYRKSARVVGDVIGRYHPHGDTAVYDTLVRMAQDFSMRLPTLDGQGNFGSMDGDAPAAMRYTEIRMARAATDLLADIDRGTVDFQPNYDGQDEEPLVLPARIPNLLVNGSEGIAVGMATKIPPHNLGEIVDAALRVIEEPDVPIEELLRIVPGPDFPTGGIIIGEQGIRRTYQLGSGSIIMRARSTIETGAGGVTQIIVHEVPFQVNKANLVSEIAELARQKTIEGIREVRDESDRHGVRVAIDLRRDATPEIVLNQLHRFTRMQTTFGANMIALVGRRPERLTLKSYLDEFLRFREEVVGRRTRYDLNDARDRAHVLCGLAIAVENIDEVVATIRAAANPAAARDALREKRWDVQKIEPYLRLIDDPDQRVQQLGDSADGKVQLSDRQVRAILELRLQRLTGLGREEISNELKELGEQIAEYLAILGSRERLLEIVAAELREVKEQHATPRRTTFEAVEEELEDESLIEPEEMIVTITQQYIKRTPIDEYRVQNRGGKGLAGMKFKEGDFITHQFVANTLTPLLFFTSDGRVHLRKVWQLPIGPRTGRGRATVNFLPIDSTVSISTVFALDLPPEEQEELSIVFVTSNGRVRRNHLKSFRNIRANGLIAMKLDEGVRLIGVALCRPDDDILITSASGKSIRFAATEARLFGSRASMGVRGMRLVEDDHIVAITAIPSAQCEPEQADAYLAARRADDPMPQSLAHLTERERTLLFVDSNGYGKRVSSHEFRSKHRGGKGMRSMVLRDREGFTPAVVACTVVDDEDEVMLATNEGQSIRCPVANVSRQSRNAGGVRLFRTKENETVVSVARIDLPEPNGDGQSAPASDAAPLPDPQPADEDGESAS